MPRSPSSPPPQQSSPEEPPPAIPPFLRNSNKPPKTFLVSQYTCKGALYFDSDDFKEAGRPRCYGIERRIMSTVELQDHFRASCSQNYSQSNFLTEFKKDRGKVIANNSELSEEDIATNDYDVADSSSFEDDSFSYKCYGKSWYPVMEYSQNGKRENITLKPPACSPGLTIREKDDWKFYIFHLAGYEVSNDISRLDPHTRKRYDELIKDQKQAKQTAEQRRRQQEEEDDAETHTIEIEINFDKAGEKMYNMAEKTLQNMNKIGHFVKAELKDDFLGRVQTSSEKIVTQFPKTVSRCKKTATDIFRWWRHSDSDGEDS